MPLPTIPSGNVNSGLATGFDVANSVRYNDDDSPKLNINFGSDGVLNKWTFSMWFKRSTLGTAQRLFCVIDSGMDDYIKFGTDDQIEWGFDHEDSNRGILKTNRVFRDVSAWYHLVCRLDTTDSTAGDRMRMYINGTEETSFATDTNPPLNETGDIGRDNNHYIGTSGSSQYFDGYIAEVCMINNQSLAPTSFGEYDEDSPTIWKPKNVSGLTAGTNGFYLDFEDSGNLGNDAFGGTDWTETNLAATDQSTDTCTNNFCTMNSLVNSYSTNVTFSEGNLKCTHPGVWGGVPGTMGVQNGRWYWEVKVTTGNSANAFTGIVAEDVNFLDSTVYDETGLLLYFVDGRKTVDGSDSEGFFDSLATNDIVGVHLDLDSGTKQVTFTKNGSTSGSAVNLTSNHTSKFVLPVSIGNSSSATANWEFNFGSPHYSITSGNADDNGYGNFEYPPNISTTKYYALCTKNLAEYG